MNYYQPNYMYPMQNYAQPQYQMQTQPVQNSQPNQDDRIWVANEAAANAYMVAANGFVRLWDSSQSVFYEKRADSSGKQFPMIVYEYAPRTNTTAVERNIDLSGYVTRDEFEKWKQTIVGREAIPNE